MSYTLNDLTGTKNLLASHYTAFRVSDRLLLTGHSHQAWPDVAAKCMMEAWNDAALHVDEKWDKAFAKANEVKSGFKRLLGDSAGQMALGSNTHELVVRFLSSLNLKDKPRLITTDGEFHTIRRQLDRLAEEGIEVIKVPSWPVSRISERIKDKINHKTAAVLVSSVFFETGIINPGLAEIADECLKNDCELLVDTYHSLNVVPFSIKESRLEQAFIVGGGYKYCQLGEGNCFLRFPALYEGRPVISGWFSEFSMLAEKKTGKVGYGTGDDLFAGSTYDPVSHYRAAGVFDFFKKQELNPEFLREISQHQIGLLAGEFLNLDLNPEIISIDNEISLSQRGGFLVFRSGIAGELFNKLNSAGVLCDYRGHSLRFGPAPYLTDSQLRDAIGILGEVVRTCK